MKKILYYFTLTFTLLLLTTSCKNTIDNCEGYACFTPPEPVFFEIIDKESGENLYTNGTLSTESIYVTNSNNKVVEHKFISENDINIIQIMEAGWNMDLETYTIYLDQNNSVIFNIDSEELHKDCCSWVKIEYFDVTSHEYEIDEKSGFIIISM